MKKRNINKLLILICLIFNHSCITAQTTSYNWINNTPYRNIDELNSDSLKNVYCKFQMYYPLNKTNLSTLIFFHGGGLTTGEKYIPTEVQNQNIICFSPNYRLSPQSRCPSYIEDAAASVAWVFTHIKNYGGNPKRIYLSGYSAGAYLANMLYLDKSYLAAYNIDPDSLAGFISFSGQMTTHFQVCWEETGIVTLSNTKRIDNFAPLNFIRKTSLPAIFYVGDSILDQPGRYEQNTEMINKLRNLGNNQIDYIKYKNLNHDTFLSPALSNAVNFIKERELYLDSLQNLINKNVITNIDNNYIHLSDKSLNIFSNEIIKYVIIYDYSGRIILQSDINSTNTKIDVSKLFKGLYFVFVKLENANLSKKILVK